jgi:antitoxin (DNA-binding transcriptional repressor) of toxin-antitoxin stability system
MTAFFRKDSRFSASHFVMATYELHYAREHLFELFDEARSGEEVIIVRADGRSCELTPLAEVKQDNPVIAAFEIPEESTGAGELVPA